MIVDMAGKVRLDALEEQKIDTAGDHVVIKTGKELAKQLATEAATALPRGVPESSPYRRFSRDELLAEAARLDMRLGPLMTEDELRLVIEHVRQKITAGSVVVIPQKQEPAPMQPAPAVARKIRGLKPSPSNTWRVDYKSEKPPTVSVGNGQMATMRRGAIVNANHYTSQILQGMIDQGLTLIPIEEPEDD